MSTAKRKGAFSGACARAGVGVLAAAVLLLGGLVSADAAAAQTPSAPRSQLLEMQREKTAGKLAALDQSLSLTKEKIAALDAEIAAIAQDQAAIRAAMIGAAAAQQQLTSDLRSTEVRITALEGDEAALKASLRDRRRLLAEVLAALQRMGRKPPPALLVKPDDALGAVRSAILLGSVVPEIREETAVLAEDLRQLAAVKREIEVERQRFVAGLMRQKEEEARLARLFAEKARLEEGSREAREAEDRRAAELAANATSLQELIASLGSELTSARAAEEAAARQAAERQAAEQERQEAARRLAEEESRQQAETRSAAAAPPAPPPTPEQPTYDIASLRRDMARIEPAAPFSTLMGRLSYPVAGAVRIGFGEDDGVGRPSAGATFAARAGDLVTAPADGWVLYSGPFRSYGQLLILNAGDGYHIVLAGMDEIDVNVGQFVLAGEPVALMGARRLASASGMDFDSSEPSLYVEFRRDGKPVDPSPWWTQGPQGPSGRTSNDS